MVRDVFLSTGHVARALIAEPEVGRRWDDPSALVRMTVGSIAAHLARGALTVPYYLAMPLPDPLPDTVDAAEYFAHGLTSDVDDELNTGIRARSNDAAAEGHASVLQSLDDCLASLTATFAALPADALVAVFGPSVMLVDDYLVTRILEFAVHIDDLAVSIGVDTPKIDPRAVELVTHCFVDIARIRNGDLEVLRALARRERVSAAVFPVF